MGAIFKLPGYIIYFIGGIWGLILCLGIVHAKIGFLGTVAAMFLFPVTIYFAPWYAGFFDDNWKPLLVVYGSGAIAFALLLIGSLIDKD